MASLLAMVEEHWLLPVYAGRNASAWIAAHRCLTVPFRSRGEVRHYVQHGVDRPLSLVTIGSPRRLRLFAERLVDTLSEVSNSGRRGTWSPSRLPSTDADIVLAEIHRWAIPRFRRAGWHIVPSAVRWQGSLSSIPPSPASRSVRDDQRKVRQHRYVLTVDDTDAGWEEFYVRMLRPLVEQRFGDEAWIPSRRFLRRLQKAATLQFICRRGERVAAFCAVPAGNSVWFPLLGVSAGDESLRREGALAAVYQLGFEWAKAQGFQYADKGRTMSFVNNGIALYKAKWGLEPVKDPLCHVFAVKINSAAGNEAFARSPVWMETEAGLAPFAGDGGWMHTPSADTDVPNRVAQA